MNRRSHARPGGVRWVVFGLFSPDRRARRSAVAWLADDPVFATRTWERRRVGEMRLGQVR